MKLDMKSLERAFAKLQIGGKVRLRTYRKIVRFLKSGVQIAVALEIMWKFASNDGRKKSAPLAIALHEWRRSIMDGQPFAQAIKGWVPERDRSVIEAGEKAGRLDLAIENAIFIHEGSSKVVTTLVAGLAYPTLLVGVAVGLLTILTMQIIPAFDAVKPKATWTGTGAQMAFVADAVADGWLPATAALVTLGALVWWSMPRWTGRLRKRFDRVPPYTFYRLLVGSGFMLSVAAMFRAGIATPEILRKLMRDAQPWYRERVSRTLYHVNNGLNLGEALHRTGYDFPDRETVADLRAYASLQDFEETLDQMGREWIEESVAKVQNQAAVLRNAAIVLLTVVFGWIASGIFSLQQQVASGL